MTKYYESIYCNYAIEVIKEDDKFVEYGYTGWQASPDSLTVCPLKVEKVDIDTFKKTLLGYKECTRTKFKDLFNKVFQLNSELKRIKNKFNIGENNDFEN